MFLKLLRFENTGVFEHFVVDSSWNKEFKKINIIYAGNGQGKTTISEVFDSLAKNDCEKVISRKRLGSSGKQEILFRTQTGEIKFTDGKWNTTVPNLFVFNSRFIKENLYAGDLIQADQKRNLHSFVIGEEGVALLKRIETLSTEIDKVKEEEIVPIEASINAKKGIMPDIKSFIKLPEVIDIDKKLHTLTSRLKDIERIGEYLKASSFEEIVFASINIDNLKLLLLKNYDGITREAEDKVKALLKNIKDKDASHWIIVGVNSIQNNKCPLCYNDVSNNDFIKLYRQFFSKNYKDFKNELADNLEAVLSRFNSVEIHKMTTLINNNNRVYEYWKDKVDGLKKYEGSYPRLLKDPNVFMERFKHCIDTKKSDILSSVSLPEDIEEDIKAFNMLISNYNKLIRQENEKIDLWKKGLAAEDSTELKRKIGILETTKIRYSDEVKPLVDKYLAAKKKIKKLNEKRDEAKEALSNYIANFNKEFPKLINSVLESFGAGFTICEAKLDFRGGAKYEYQVNINGHSISLVNTDPNAPQLKNTLSDGDKTTLALAFFIAKIMTINNKAESIVVVDDPISSLDIFRKGKTADYLYRISSEVKQIFVLTHNIIFGMEFYNRVKHENPLCLEILNGRIQRLNFQEKEKIDYFVNYDILFDYVNNQGKESEMSVCRAIRPILEGYLRFNYPKNFPQNKWLGDYIEDIRNFSTEPYNTLKKYLSDIEEFNAYYKKYHHTQGSVPAIDPIELKTYAKRVLEFCSLQGK